MYLPNATIQNPMKQKIESGELALGMIVRIVRGVEIAAIAKSAGFDSLYIDLEHSSFSLETVGQICMAATALGVTPLVRLPELNAGEVSRTLEAGAQGIIIPHLETRAHAETVVEAALFPPFGKRSLLLANPHTLFRTEGAAQTMRDMNAATLVVAMIESVTAVENAAEIASVPGMDMLLVGTNDLSVSLGVPGELEHVKVREAYAQVASACRKHAKHLGIGGLSSRPDFVKQLIPLGARYISAGSDTGFLMGGAIAAAKALR